MQSIIQFISEKLKIDASSEITSVEDAVLKDILKHFEFDDLYEIDKNRLQNEPYITEDDGEEIKKALKDFIKENNISKESLQYYTYRGYKFKDKKIAKDFKKDNVTLHGLTVQITTAKDNKEIFKKKSLRFEVSGDAKIIGMFGPMGGAKYCIF